MTAQQTFIMVLRYIEACHLRGFQKHLLNKIVLEEISVLKEEKS